MGVLVLNSREVRQLLPMPACIDLMAETLAALSSGEALQPLRTVTQVPGGKGVLVSMPACIGPRNAAGIKVLTVFPGNWGTKFHSHQGVILLFEAEHGSMQAIIDAVSVTGIRTAAVSGAATRILAREDATDLAILGTGYQAKAHLEAMLAARPIRRVRVWSRNSRNRSRFAAEMSKQYSIDVEACDSAGDAVRNATLICTVTSAKEPVLEGASVSEGAHINAVGACTPASRELDTTLIVRSSLYTDRMESLLNEAGDFLIPHREGKIGAEQVKGELGDVLSGKIPGRASPGEITIFKSLGLAVEDVACAHFLFKRALANEAGTFVELGEQTHEPE